NNRISSETNLLRALIAERGDSNFRAIALTNKIDHLSGITLSSITISSVSGLTDADIPNDITIASSAGLSATTGSFSSTFGVTGLSTFTGGFLSQASSTVASNLNVGGPLSASSTLSVAEAASLLSTLSVSSLSTLAGFISTASSSVSAGLQVAGAFNASSTSFFNGLLTFGNATGTQLTTTGSTYLATTGGNVGIGTTSPFRKFSVKSTESNPQFALSYDDSTFSDFQIDSTGDLIFNPSGDDVFLNDDNLWVCSGGACSAGTPAGTGNLIVETRLGIGTSTPNWALQLAGTRPFLTLSDTSAGTDLKHWFFSSQGGNLYVGTTTDGYATTTGYQFLTMTNTGRLGIGTTSPYAPFSLHTTANSVPMFAIGSTSPTGGFNTVFDITSYGTTTVPAGSLITTSRPCANNYVRVGLWCMATTTVLLRANAASDESAWTTNTVNSAATRLVMLKFVARAIDGTNSFSIQNCGVPADYTGPDCSALGIGDFGQGAIAEGSAAGRASHYNTEILKTDNLGQVKTWCEVTTAADTTTCGWTIMGYME
ncbi:MAG: hypothetical protein HYT22_02100, partial [Candidatus Niyogibacteria bacterium]|nr:hypothetical protein [Candidatus Niyogibacteria bacterium]